MSRDLGAMMVVTPWLLSRVAWCCVASLALFGAGTSQLLLDEGTRPRLASPAVLPYNPSASTVVLARPICDFPSRNGSVIGVVVAQVGKGYTFSVMLGAVGSWVGSGAGERGPYLAGVFPVPPCAQPPAGPPSSGSVELLQLLLFRLGGDTGCPEGIVPDAAAIICNGPLRNGTAYRVKFALLKRTALFSLPDIESPWSDSISTRAPLSASAVFTWPGKRSGGMVVVTAGLSSALGLLLLGLVASLFAPSRGGKEISQEARSTQISGMEAQFRNKAFDEGQVAAETLKP